MGKFLSQLEMNIIRRETQIADKQLKENPIRTHYTCNGPLTFKVTRSYHVICGCGVLGCFFLGTIGEKDKISF